MQSLTETEIKNFIQTQLQNTVVDGEVLSLVACQFKPQESLIVFLDHLKGVSLEKCQELHYKINDFLEKHQVDVVIEVSSYSITEPFLLPLHYQKNLNRKIEGQLKNSEFFSGLLTDFKDEKIQVSPILDLKKKKKKEEETNTISWIAVEEIQWIKLKF